jgi:hypothetical protein
MTRSGERQADFLARSGSSFPAITMNVSINVEQLRESGWVRVNGAVPVVLCNRLVAVLERELGVPVNDPSRWDACGDEMRDLVPIWGHQTQWDIRQYPNLHRIWAELWVLRSYACHWIHVDSTPLETGLCRTKRHSLGSQSLGRGETDCFKAYWRSPIQQSIKVDSAASPRSTAIKKRGPDTRLLTLTATKNGAPIQRGARSSMCPRRPAI